MRAPVSRRPSIFGSPALPAPITKHCRPSSFMNIGNRLVTGTSCKLCQSLRIGQIASDGGYAFSREEFTELIVVVARKETAQIFPWFAIREITRKQTLERIGNFSRQAPEPNRARRRLMQS